MSRHLDVPTPHMRVLAALALEHAVVEEWEEAKEILADIVRTYEWTGVFTALLSWADMVINEVGFPEGLHVNLIMEDGITGRQGTADVPPDILWAGKFLAARAARDVEGLRDLLRPDSYDDEFIKLCTLSTLTCAGVTIAKARAERG
jgi:hypothetical protein